MIKVINKLKQKTVSYADLGSGDLFFNSYNNLCMKLPNNQYFDIDAQSFEEVFNATFECTSPEYSDMTVTYNSSRVPLSEIHRGDVFYYGGYIYLKISFGTIFRLPQFSDQPEIISPKAFMDETIKVAPAILEITIGE